MSGLRFIILCCVFLATASLSVGDSVAPFTPVAVYRALKASYSDAIGRMGLKEGHVFFLVNGSPIYFVDGKMLSEDHRDESYRFDSMLYDYTLGQMSVLPESGPHPVNRSADFLEALLGGNGHRIALSCSWVNFLDHRVFIHEICVQALQRVEVRVRAASEESAEVRSFIENIHIMFSMDVRKVDGSDALSYHAYGLAIDIVPSTYEDKQVYWRWTSAWNDAWESTPLSERWTPPQAVIDAFEAEGFVWGGKWYHFDTIHFEYRPEIIALGRQRTSRRRMGEEEEIE